MPHRRPPILLVIVLSFLLVPVSGGAIAPDVTAGETPQPIEIATTCREVVAIGLKNENSLYWYRPRVLDVALKYMHLDLSLTATTQRLIQDLAIAVPNRERRYELTGDIARAIAVSKENELCQSLI